MKKLSTDIAIAAGPEQVWPLLLDLERYSDWNPFIVEARGDGEVGALLHLRMSPPGGRTVSLKPRVTVVQRGEVFEWLGRIAIPGLFAGRHRFELHRTETGTRLVQEEVFTGLLVPLLARSLDAHTLPGFVAMNEALKRRAEKVTTGG